MHYDWLFQWPETVRTWSALAEVLEAELARQPDAAAIPDEEAEQFAAIAWGLNEIPVNNLATFCRGLRVKVQYGGEKARRTNVVAVLRTWPSRKHREFLLKLPATMSAGPIPEANRGVHRITAQMLADAWSTGRVSLAWVILILSYLDRPDSIDAIMEAGGKTALNHRRAWVATGKLLMRRLLGREQAEAQARQLAGQRQSLQQRFRQQETLLKALEADVAQVAQRRDLLRQAARDARANVEELLAQARAEVAAAAADVEQRKAVHVRELADLAGRYEPRLQELTRRLENMRAEQAAALRERGRSGAGPLAGLTFSLTGLKADPEGCRALIESAGGRVVKDQAAVNIVLGADAEGSFMTTGTGLADLERVIHRQVLPQLLALRTGRTTG